MTARANAPYWLTGGTEICFLCQGGYVLEMEYRCSACDRGCCEQCVVIVHATPAIFCRECAPEEAG